MACQISWKACHEIGKGRRSTWLMKEVIQHLYWLWKTNIYFQPLWRERGCYNILSISWRLVVLTSLIVTGYLQMWSKNISILNAAHSVCFLSLELINCNGQVSSDNRYSVEWELGSCILCCQHPRAAQVDRVTCHVVEGEPDSLSGQRLDEMSQSIKTPFSLSLSVHLVLSRPPSLYH